MSQAIRRVVAAVLLMTAVDATTASAQSSLGQSFLVPSSPNTFLSALSVTDITGVGGSDPFLAQIFSFTPSAAWNLSSAIVGPALFTQPLGTSFSGFSLTPNLNLTAGGSYLLLLTAPASFVSYNFSSGVNSYAGKMFSCSNSSCNAFYGPGDVLVDLGGLSLTFTTPPTVVPEPSTYALLASGLVLLGMAATRRKRGA
jgi:hypothetical protein